MARRALLGGLAVALVVLSLLWWRIETDYCECEHCPDGYCTYAERLATLALARDLGAVDALRTYTQGYMHAHSLLAPTLVALLALPTGSTVLAFMLVSVAATLVAWRALRRSIVTAWAPPVSLEAWLFAGFLTHALVLRALARPMTDALGLACVAVALRMIQRHQTERSSRSALLLGAAQLAGLFSRVSFIPMLGMPVLAELVGPGRWPVRLARATRAGVIFGLGPGFCFLGLHWLLGGSSLGLTWEFAHRPGFTAFATPAHFLVALTLAGQGYAVVAIAVGRLTWLGHPAFRLHAAWIALYGTFLALGGGALWPRYFLPMVPSVFVLATPALARLPAANLRAVMVLFLAGNVLYATPVSRDHLGEPARLLLNELSGLATGRAQAQIALSPAGAAVSDRSEIAYQVIDGVLETGWSPGRPQVPGRWVTVDLGAVRVVSGLALHGPPAQYPRRYGVDTSVDGQAWVMAVRRGHGLADLRGFLDPWPRLRVDFPPRPARFVRVTSAATHQAPWSVHEVKVYGPPPAVVTLPGRRGAG